MAGRPKVLLLERQRFASRYPGCHSTRSRPKSASSNRMLNLQAGVDFKEVELAWPYVEKFYGAGVVVGEEAANLEGCRREGLPVFLRERWRRRLFPHLLIPALKRTLSFVEVNQVAVLVAKELYLNVAGARESTVQGAGRRSQKR